MNKLHTRDQEAMDLTHHLWKAHKAAPDENFLTYIKDKKSQVHDGRETYTAEELMTLAENVYEAMVLDEDNAWGTPSDEQEQILAMTAEIKALKQGNNKGSKSNKKGKDRFSQNKSNEDRNNEDTKKKNKTNDKWAWKNIAPKDTNAKEDGMPVREFQKEKYFGAHITTKEQACGLSTIPRTANP